jgi:hypothetical protein
LRAAPGSKHKGLTIETGAQGTASAAAAAGTLTAAGKSGAASELERKHARGSSVGQSLVVGKILLASLQFGGEPQIVREVVSVSFDGSSVLWVQRARLARRTRAAPSRTARPNPLITRSG